MNKEALLNAFKVGTMNVNGFDVGTVIRDLYAQLEASDPKGSFDKHMEYMRKNVDLINENSKLRALLEEALGSVHSDAGRCESSTLHAELIDLGDRITAFLAPKYCECPPGTDRCITQGGHFPACTACKRRIK